MALTRAQVEALLVPRTRALLAEAQMATTTAGSNADLNNALADTLLRFGVIAADPTLVADADLAALPADAASVRAFLDWAELRLKRDILAAVQVLVTQSGQTNYTNLSDLARALKKDIDEAQARLDLQYSQGLGRAVLTPIARPDVRGPRTPGGWGWCP